MKGKDITQLTRTDPQSVFDQFLLVMLDYEWKSFFEFISEKQMRVFANLMIDTILENYSKNSLKTIAK